MSNFISKLTRFSSYPQYLKYRLSKIKMKINYCRLKRMGVSVDADAIIIGKPIVSMVPGSNVSIGSRVRLVSVSEETALGVNHPCVIRAMSEGAEIVIKDYAGMSGATICCVSKIEIGERVMLGANVTITDTDFHSIDWEKRWTVNDLEYANKASVVIEDDVFVGMNSSILKNVRIGEKSVIGAHSVVTKSIPPYSIAAGNPARVIGRVQDYLDR